MTAVDLMAATAFNPSGGTDVKVQEVIQKSQSDTITDAINNLSDIMIEGFHKDK